MGWGGVVWGWMVVVGQSAATAGLPGETESQEIEAATAAAVGLHTHAPRTPPEKTSDTHKHCILALCLT